MSRTAHFVPSRSTESAHRSTGHRNTLASLARDLAAAEAVVISTLPRGGLQIVQPQRATEGLVRAYSREFHTQDQASWGAITTGKAVAAAPGDAYLRFIAEFGYAHAASVPIADPVFEGYAGAVQLLRTAAQGPFSAADLGRLTEIAADLELPAAAGRPRPAPKTDAVDASWCVRPPKRMWAIGSRDKVLAFDCSFGQLDSQLREQLIEQAHIDAGALQGETSSTRRVALPDTEGDFWTFNLVAFSRYPALANGPVTFVCLQPDFPEWVNVRSADFQADPELSRLVPALKFMQQEFRRVPTLGEIAQTVQLSPFHFHRRFSELLGLTPKHFLLECQIHEAKHELLAGAKSLSKIAADCGFAHQSHFTSRFKQTTGLTPTRWRRLARNRVQAGNAAAA